MKKKKLLLGTRGGAWLPAAAKEGNSDGARKKGEGEKLREQMGATGKGKAQKRKTPTRSGLIYICKIRGGRTL